MCFCHDIKACPPIFSTIRSDLWKGYEPRAQTIRSLAVIFFKVVTILLARPVLPHCTTPRFTMIQSSLS